MHVVGPRPAITTHHVKVLVDSKDQGLGFTVGVLEFRI